MNPKQAHALKRMQDILGEAMQKIQKEFPATPDNATILTSLFLSLAASAACAFGTDREDFTSSADAIWLEAQKQLNAQQD